MNPWTADIYYDGPSYYDFHHGQFKDNYAGALGYLDKILEYTIGGARRL